MYLAKGTLFNAYPFKVKGGFKIMNEERKVAEQKEKLLQLC